MKPTTESSGIRRFVALDIHKEYVMVGAMNAAQEWLIRPKKVEMLRFREWAARNLGEGDAVVTLAPHCVWCSAGVETTTNVWDIYDIVAPLVTRAVAAHAGAVRQIAEARVKTDAEDVKRLLRLLIAGIVPEACPERSRRVWVPPAHVRELRGLISYRNRLVVNGAAIRNRLQSLVHRHNLRPPKGELTNADWWQSQPLSALEQMQVRQELALLAQVEQNKTELDDQLARMSSGKTWGEQAARLLQLPGIGLIAAMTVLAAVGDIRRFQDPKCLVGYAGLGAGVHASGKEHKDKGITKSGRKPALSEVEGELRWALIEAAWRAVRSSPFWEQRFQELAKRRGEHKAIVAIARKLLVAIWYVLMRSETNRNASEEDLAWKMLLWSWSMGDEARLGLTPKQFAKYSLMRLGVASDITEFQRGKVLRRIAPADEVLTRLSELGLTL